MEALPRPDPDPPRYRARANLFHPETGFALHGEHLIVERRGVTEKVPYGEIVSIRHSTVAVGRRPITWMRRCWVKTRTDAFLIQSAHYSGWGTFESRSPSYEPFVQELVGHVRHARPDASIMDGMTVVAWLGWLATLLIGIVCAIEGLWFLPQGLVLTASGVAAIPLAYAMVAKGHARPVA